MSGNPFFYTSWTSQYAVFEISLENFVRIDSIFFYQEGFISDSEIENEDDILVKDLQFYLMKPLTDLNGQYQLKVEAQETGMIFNDSVNKINLTANLTREFFENLNGNSDTQFF
jgi:hypothetical protein